jgi:hypothetical protein
MKEITQSFEKPLEKHCKKKLALTIGENGFDQPHKRTFSSHPPQLYPKSQMMKMETL